MLLIYPGDSRESEYLGGQYGCRVLVREGSYIPEAPENIAIVHQHPLGSRDRRFLSWCRRNADRIAGCSLVVSIPAFYVPAFGAESVKAGISRLLEDLRGAGLEFAGPAAMLRSRTVPEDEQDEVSAVLGLDTVEGLEPGGNRVLVSLFESPDAHDIDSAPSSVAVFAIAVLMLAAVIVLAAFSYVYVPEMLGRAVMLLLFCPAFVVIAYMGMGFSSWYDGAGDSSHADRRKARSPPGDRRVLALKAALIIPTAVAAVASLLPDSSECLIAMFAYPLVFAAMSENLQVLDRLSWMYNPDGSQNFPMWSDINHAAIVAGLLSVVPLLVLIARILLSGDRSPCPGSGAGSGGRRFSRCRSRPASHWRSSSTRRTGSPSSGVSRSSGSRASPFPT